MKPGRDHSIGAAAAKAGPGRATGCRIAQDTRLPSRKGAPRGRRRGAAAAGCTRATARHHLRGDAAPSSRVAAGHPPDAGAPNPGLAGPARGRPGGDLPAGPRTGPARPAGFHRQGRSGSRSRANGLIICSPTSACRGRGSSRPMSFPAASALWPWPKGFGTPCGRQAAPRRPVAPSAFRVPGRVHRASAGPPHPFRNPDAEARTGLATRCEAPCTHGRMVPTRNNKGAAHENGSVESAHDPFRGAIRDALLMRGSSDFADLGSCRAVIDDDRRARECRPRQGDRGRTAPPRRTFRPAAAPISRR